MVREETTLLPCKRRMRGTDFQGADGHSSPGSLWLFVPVVPHFCCATCAQGAHSVLSGDLPVVSRILSPGSKLACPLSEGSCHARGGKGGEVIAELLGEVVCPARSCSSPRVYSRQGSRGHQAQVSQEGASRSPALG